MTDSVDTLEDKKSDKSKKSGKESGDNKELQGQSQVGDLVADHLIQESLFSKESPRLKRKQNSQNQINGRISKEKLSMDGEKANNALGRTVQTNQGFNKSKLKKQQTDRMKIKVRALGSGQFDEYGDENAQGYGLQSPADEYGGVDEEFKELDSPYDMVRRGSRNRQDEEVFDKLEMNRVESPDGKPSNSVYQPRIAGSKISTTRVLRQVTFGVQTQNTKKRSSFMQNVGSGVYESPDKPGNKNFSRLSSGLKQAKLDEAQNDKKLARGMNRRKSEMKAKSSNVVDSERDMLITQTKWGEEV